MTNFKQKIREKWWANFEILGYERTDGRTEQNSLDISAGTGVQLRLQFCRVASKIIEKYRGSSPLNQFKTLKAGGQ